MTLEVSLLFPMILLILIILLYLIFYSYNKTIAFQNASITALYGKCFSYTEIEKEVLVDNMYCVLRNINENQYVALDTLEQEVGIENGKIKIIQSGDMIMPLFNEEINSNLSFIENVIVDELDAVFYIRQIRKVNLDDDGNN